jgi:Ca2+-binding RTX toxin-like protein
VPAPIHLTGSFTLADGQMVSFTDPWPTPAYLDTAYILQAPATSTGVQFMDAGTINVSDAADPSSYLYGVFDQTLNLVPYNQAPTALVGNVVIGSTGAINVTGANRSYDFGYWSLYGGYDFENDGSITVTSPAGSATGVSNGTANNSRTGVKTVNTGTIAATGVSAVGVALGGSGSFSNSGSIVVQGGAGGVYGVQVSPWTAAAGGVIHIVNSGQITVTASGGLGGGGIGASYGGSGYAGDLTIDNSGVITADRSILVASSESNDGPLSVVLHNSGTLNGDVFVGAAQRGWFYSVSAQIYNAGHINGAVDLYGRGNDIYDGRGGTLSGALALGDGSSTVYLGNDGETVQGGEGAAIIYGGSGSDTLIGGGGRITFYAGGGDDVVSGVAGVTFYAGGGNSVLTGGGILPQMGGGLFLSPTNTVAFAAAPSGVTVDLNQTSAQHTGFGVLTIVHFDSLIGSAHDDHLTGDWNDNFIDGGSGGADVLDGGYGSDTVSFASAASGVTISLALQGTTQAVGSGSVTFTNFENLVGSAFADHLTGDAGDNVIDGGGGADVLDGGGGTNTLSFTSAAKGVTASLALQGQAQDTGVGSVTASNFQNLTGSAFNDILEGDGNNNFLNGGGGHDTVTFAHAASGVTASLTLGRSSGGAGSETFYRIQNITGSAYDDTLEGDGADNVLDGGGGANTVSYANAGSTMGVTVSLALQGTAQNTVGEGVDTLYNFQALVGSNYNDTLEGGGGPFSFLTGGLGGDTFVYAPGEGKVVVTDFSFAQGDKIDLSRMGLFFNLNDVLSASRQVFAAAVINLGGGSLTLPGLSTYNLTAADFIFTAGPSVGPGVGGTPTTGNGTLTGGFGADWLQGGAGNDSLHGGAGSDYLDGGAGLNIATYDGVFRQYTVSHAETVVFGGPEGGADFLTNIQRIQFVDGYLAVSPTDTAGQVYRLYEAALGRAPDPVGLAGWTHALNGGTSLQSVANGFVTSQEFQQVYGQLSDKDFVTLLYHNVLHRDPDTGGLNAWLGVLTQGASRAEVLVGFSESSENVSALAAPVEQGLWIQDPAAAEVARLYDTTLGRLPDSSGLAGWTHALESGSASLLQVTQGFIGSQEFQQVYGPLTDDGFVKLLYHNVLHRDPDPGGLASWVAALSQGASRAQVVIGFSESAEHIQNTAAHIDNGIWLA